MSGMKMPRFSGVIPRVRWDGPGQSDLTLLRCLGFDQKNAHLVAGSLVLEWGGACYVPVIIIGLFIRERGSRSTETPPLIFYFYSIDFMTFGMRL